MGDKLRARDIADGHRQILRTFFPFPKFEKRKKSVTPVRPAPLVYSYGPIPPFNSDK